SGGRWRRTRGATAATPRTPWDRRTTPVRAGPVRPRPAATSATRSRVRLPAAVPDPPAPPCPHHGRRPAPQGAVRGNTPPARPLSAIVRRHMPTAIRDRSHRLLPAETARCAAIDGPPRHDRLRVHQGSHKPSRRGARIRHRVNCKPWDEDSQELRLARTLLHEAAHATLAVLGGEQAREPVPFDGEAGVDVRLQ